MAKSGPKPNATDDEIRAYKKAHPEVPMTRIAAELRTSPTRVKEALESVDPPTPDTHSPTNSKEQRGPFSKKDLDQLLSFASVLEEHLNLQARWTALDLEVQRRWEAARRAMGREQELLAENMRLKTRMAEMEQIMARDH